MTAATTAAPTTPARGTASPASTRSRRSRPSIREISRSASGRRASRTAATPTKPADASSDRPPKMPERDHEGPHPPLGPVPQRGREVDVRRPLLEVVVHALVVRGRHPPPAPVDGRDTVVPVAQAYAVPRVVEPADGVGLLHHRGAEHGATDLVERLGDDVLVGDEGAHDPDPQSGPVVGRGRARLLVVVVPAVVDVVTHGEPARVGRQLADGGLVRPLRVREATSGDHRLVHVVEATVGREGQRVLAAGHRFTVVVDAHEGEGDPHRDVLHTGQGPDGGVALRGVLTGVDLDV